MLDHLGSTLTQTTVSSLFACYGKDPHRNDLTVVDEAIVCLEEVLGRPDSEKKRLDADDGKPETRDQCQRHAPILGASGARAGTMPRSC